MAPGRDPHPTEREVHPDDAGEVEDAADDAERVQSHSRPSDDPAGINPEGQPNAGSRRDGPAGQRAT